MIVPQSAPFPTRGPSISTLVVPDPEAPPPRRVAVDLSRPSTADAKAAVAPLHVPLQTERSHRARRSRPWYRDCCRMHLLAALLAIVVGAVVLVFFVVAAIRAKGEPVNGVPPPLSQWAKWDDLRDEPGLDERRERANLDAVHLLHRPVHEVPPLANTGATTVLPDSMGSTDSVWSLPRGTRGRDSTDKADSPPIVERTGRSRQAATRFDGGTGPRHA